MYKRELYIFECLSMGICSPVLEDNITINLFRATTGVTVLTGLPKATGQPYKSRRGLAWHGVTFRT
jgi:hypothetical protein